MKKFNSSCPIPIEQQPFYEYDNLKKSPFFSWTMENTKLYLKNVGIIVLLNVIIGSIFVKMANLEDTDLVTQLLFTNIIGNIFSLIFLFRIYIGWKYIYVRLKESTICYEESGWYDGELWIKSSEELLKDSIIADYIIFPILKKLKNTMLFLFISFIISFINM